LDNAFTTTPEMRERLEDFVQSLLTNDPELFTFEPNTLSVIEFSNFEDLKGVLTGVQENRKIEIHVCQATRNAYDHRLTEETKEKFYSILNEAEAEGLTPIVFTWPEGWLIMPGEIMTFEAHQVGEA